MTEALPRAGEGSDSGSTAYVTDPLQRLYALEAQVDALYELMPFGSYRAAADGKIVSINDVALAWLGREREELVGKTIPDDWLTPESLARLDAQMIASGDKDFDDCRLNLMGRDGIVRHIVLSEQLVGDPARPTRSRRFVLMDVTESWRTIERQRIAALAFDTLVGICVTDGAGNILQVNKAFTTLTGYGIEDVSGNLVSFIRTHGFDQDSYDVIWRSLRARGTWEGDIHELRKNGRAFIGWLSITSIRRHDGSVSYYVGSLYDITVARTSEAEIARLANYDSLTQLPNRRHLQEELNRVLALSARSRLYGALLYIDLDSFKSLNDTRGHPMGDLLLVEVGRRLLRGVRHEDTVARIGGDEFVIVLVDLGVNETDAAYKASLISRKILASLAAPYQLPGAEFSCTASIGVCLFGGSDTVADILQRADLAMYQVKDSGRNNLCFYNPEMQAVVTTRVKLEQELRQALLKGQFELHYQPQVGADGRIYGAEALLRWHHPERGLITAEEFISTAEDLDTILEIGSWVLKTACAQIKAWETTPVSRQLLLAVNVSAHQFRQHDFVNEVREIINDSGADPTRLMLELTESITHDIDDTRSKMMLLRDAGLTFSLDDFGTGYSSLSVLTKLPLRQLKIALPFVANMLTSPADAAIVSTVISMAQTLALEVIAEGVETKEQRDFLAMKGCTSFQGFLFGRALNISEFEKVLMR